MSLLERDRKLSREGKRKTEREKGGQFQNATARTAHSTDGIHRQVEPALPAGGGCPALARTRLRWPQPGRCRVEGRRGAGSRRWGGAAGGLLRGAGEA